MSSLIGRSELAYKLFSSDYPFMKKAVDQLHEFTNSVIKQRRTRLAKEKSSIVQDVDGKKKLAFLDMLLEATVEDRPLSDEDIREEVDTFMFEGHDTTSVSLTFSLMLLAQHPDVQQKLCSELLALVQGDPLAKFTYDDLNQMKYLECVIKESLRMYPSVPIIGRIAREDIRLTSKF
jgi:cytochrome P450 family 4